MRKSHRWDNVNVYTFATCGVFDAKRGTKENTSVFLQMHFLSLVVDSCVFGDFIFLI